MLSTVPVSSFWRGNTAWKAPAPHWSEGMSPTLGGHITSGIPCLPEASGPEGRPQQEAVPGMWSVHAMSQEHEAETNGPSPGRRRVGCGAGVPRGAFPRSSERAAAQAVGTRRAFPAPLGTDGLCSLRFSVSRSERPGCWIRPALCSVPSSPGGGQTPQCPRPACAEGRLCPRRMQ